MDLYPWIVFVHVAAAFAFALSHGASAFASFRIRAERDPLKIRALLELSTMTLATMYVSFLILLIMFLLQSVFVAFRTSQPMIAALHPVNGFLIILVGIVLAREGRRVGWPTPSNPSGA